MILSLASSALAACSIAKKDTLDSKIKKFLDGIDVTIPSLDSYKMEHELFFSYEYQQYAISASVKTTEKLDEQYNKTITSKSGLVSANDDIYYPIEEVGYIYVDSLSDPKVELYFYVDAGEFQVTIWRDDGKAGKLNVKDIDTSWYVDYVRDFGFTVGDSFPSSDIKAKLNIPLDVEIPIPTSNKYCYQYQEAYEDEWYGHISAMYYVFAEGDISKDYAKALTDAGYTITSEEVEDFFTGDTYLEYTGYDASKEVYITMYEDEVATQIIYQKFSDLFVTELTKRTDWTDSEKALMNTCLGEVLPFVQLGSDYEVGNSIYYEALYVFYIEDSYFEDRSDLIEQMLIDDGFTMDGDYGVYIKTVGDLELEASYGYDGGNYLYIYYEQSGMIY